MHRYYWQDGGSDEDFFACYRDMDEFIQTIKATADYVKAKHRSRKTMMISFDEWNVWYQHRQGSTEWGEAPRLLEDIYTLKDALVFSGMLNTLMNNCDRVKIACLAQLVNVIAPIFTKPGGPAIKQSIYHPFASMSAYGRGLAIGHLLDCPMFCSSFGDTKSVSSAIAFNEPDREISLFLVNYSTDRLDLSLELRGFGDLKSKASIVLEGDLDSSNSFEQPDAVAPKERELPIIKGMKALAELPPLSYSMIRFGVE
jgi:alpha-N-arabinofuranosidase